MKLVNIVGARPQFIKAAVISRAIIKHNADHSNAYDGIEEIIVHTGQHYDAAMKEVFFNELGIPDPDVDLGVGSGSHAQQTAEMMKRLNEAEPTMVNEPSGPTTMFDLRTSGRGLLSLGAATLLFYWAQGIRRQGTARPSWPRAPCAHTSAPTGGELPCAFGGQAGTRVQSGGPGAYSSAQG